MSSRAEAFHYKGQARSEIPKYVVCVIVEDSVTVIPASAFRECDQLQQVIFGVNLKVIEEEAFAYCAKLASVSFACCKLLETIGEAAFNNCTGLKEITLCMEGRLTTMDDRCFLDCHSLAHIKLPDSVTYLGKTAFGRCRKLETLLLSESLRTIEQTTFAFCQSLRTVRIPFSVESIGGAAFSSCSQLISVEMNQWGMMEYIDRVAFSNCSSLVIIRLPNAKAVPGVPIRLGSDVFEHCDKLLQAIGNHDPEHQPLHRQRFPGMDTGTMLLMDRFESKPIHMVCYNSKTNENAGASTQDRIDESGKLWKGIKNMEPQVDFCGMTPFHILAISQQLDPTFYRALGSILPQELQWQEDMWDRTPLYYLCANPSPLAPSLIQDLLQTRLLDRIVSVGWKNSDWQADLVRDCNDIDWTNVTSRSEQAGTLFAKMKRFEFLEGISLLELALWKFKLEKEFLEVINVDGFKKKQPRTIDRTSASHAVLDSSDQSNRQGMRDHCGAPVVIPNVLSFLDPLPDLSDSNALAF